jgi:hypothetical protein
MVEHANLSAGTGSVKGERDLSVRLKFETEIDVTASLRVNANTAPVVLLLMFKNELGSFAQVITGAVVSGIVAMVVADVVDMFPAIPF